MSGLTNKKYICSTGSVEPAVADARMENMQTAVTLQRRADTLLSEGKPEAAISLLTTALIKDPGRSSLIHKLGQCLDKTGSEKDAVSCFRGSLPDSINEQYFNSSSLTKVVKPASLCNGVEYLPAFEPEEIELEPPVRNKTDKRYPQFNYRKTEARETFCTVAANGSIWFDGFNTVAFDCEDNIIEQQTKGNEFTCYHAMKESDACELDGTACFLDGRSSRIYYHWILDILPKLGVLEKSGLAVADIDYFIVSASSTFQLATLRACGVREDQLVFSRATSLYCADKMIIPCLRNDLGERVYHGLGVGLASWIPDFLKTRLSRGQDDNQPPSDASDSAEPVKVYISRSARGSRNIANEPAMIEALQSRGFITVEFENLTVVQQAELMSRATIVVGVHGAGFTNLSFCKPGTRVIEIFGDYVVPCYWALCAVAGLAYAQFMAKSVDSSSTAANPGQMVAQLRDREIEIDVDAFIDYVDAVLSDSTHGDSNSLPGSASSGNAVSA